MVNGETDIIIPYRFFFLVSLCAPKIRGHFLASFLARPRQLSAADLDASLVLFYLPLIFDLIIYISNDLVKGKNRLTSYILNNIENEAVKMIANFGSSSSVESPSGSRSRSILCATELCEGHPISNRRSSPQHEYPKPKQYQRTQSKDNSQVFEEMTGAVRSYHHRFSDPLAFENRHKAVIDEEPDAFRRTKVSGDIKSSTLDSFGNPNVVTSSTINERIERVKMRSSGLAISPLAKTKTREWTRLSKTNIGLPSFSSDMSKNNVSICFE
jgi:hypothetical protein